MRRSTWQKTAAFLLLTVLAVPPGMALLEPAGERLPAPGPAQAGDLAATAALPERRELPPELAAIEMGRMYEIDVPAPQPVDKQLRIEPAVPWTASHGEPHYRCPQGTEENLGEIVDPEVQVLRAQCPFRVLDEADLLGSPQLAVRHDDPREMAFFSLHGAATSDGPTPRSRDPQNAVGSKQSHTTFTSANEGWNWADNPHGNEGFGETASGIMSRDGNMFISYLFSRAAGEVDNENVFTYHFRLYKENTAADKPGYKGFEIEARDPGNIIDEVNMVLVQPPSQIETQEEYDSYMENRTEEEDNATAPSDDSDVGNYTIPRDAEDYSEDIIAAVWHEKAYDYENSPTGKSSWIDIVWTDASSRPEWHKMPDEHVVGPCRDASNPVAWNGRVYVACVVDAGYTGRRGAVIGDVDIWQFDLQNEHKTLLSTVQQMQDGRPRLAANSDGRFVVTSTKPVGVEEPYEGVRVEMSWGWYGRKWDGSPFDVGHHFYDSWGVPVRDARLSALVLLDDANVAYMVYMERANTTVRDPSVDPNGPPGAATIEYHKAIGAFECNQATPLALYDLQIGVARHPFEEGLVEDATGVFDDLHDGLAVVREGGHPGGEELIYFAIGDHGVIQYGALEGTGVKPNFCQNAAGIPPLFTPAPAVPAPLLIGSGASVAMTSLMVAPAAVMFGSLLIAKRKNALAAAVKAR